MSTYLHFVSGFFEKRDHAETIVNQLMAQGIDAKKIHLIDDETPLPNHKAADSSDNVLKEIIVDGAIGTAVGTGVGALLTVAMIGANVTLFVASPLIGPLVMLGWGASIGGLVGASVGASQNMKPLSNLVHDAIIKGGTVVIVEAHDEEEASTARQIFKDAVGDYNENLVSDPNATLKKNQLNL